MKKLKGAALTLPLSSSVVTKAIGRGTLKIEGVPQPGDLKALQRELKKRERVTVDGRGAVDGDPDNKQPHLVQKIEFTPDPSIPVMSYRIRYYQSSNDK